MNLDYFGAIFTSESLKQCTPSSLHHHMLMAPGVITVVLHLFTHDTSTWGPFYH